MQDLSKRLPAENSNESTNSNSSNNNNNNINNNNNNNNNNTLDGNGDFKRMDYGPFKVETFSSYTTESFTNIEETSAPTDLTQSGKIFEIIFILCFS